jgi:hypothetical protein
MKRSSSGRDTSLVAHSILVLLSVGSATAATFVVACGSSDDASNNSSDASTGSDSTNQLDDAGTKQDSAARSDACASETFGESCAPDAGCGCGGLCAERKCVAPSKCDEGLLTWNGPTENVDGTCIDDLKGFTLNWWLADGGSPADHQIDAGFPCVPGDTFKCGDAGKTVVQAECSYRFTKLTNGSWDFTSSSYSDAGVMSAPSGIAQDDIHCP